jgi:hypothetical protein
MVMVGSVGGVVSTYVLIQYDSSFSEY